jgi:23S rRNA (pseudouridine1915-N3)-methyltransferase
MNVTIIAVDKLRETYVREGCRDYMKRLAPYFRVDVVEVRAGRGAGAPEVEARSIIHRIDNGATFWALDRSGSSMTSLALARAVSRVERSGARRLVLAIGGADGLHRSVLSRADLRWSLSDLTFLHEMTRLIVLEQLYRSAKINRREPYHR